MKNPVLFFALLLLASSFAYHQSAPAAAPKQHPINAVGDTLYYNGELVGAKLAKQHLKQGKYILMTGGKRPQLTECEQDMLNDLNLELLNAYGCVVNDYLLQQVRDYNETVKAYFKAKKGIPDIQAYYRQRFADCHPVGCG
jgi:hypothetical protein